VKKEIGKVDNRLKYQEVIIPSAKKRFGIYPNPSR
jgi:hypothetical protein